MLPITTMSGRILHLPRTYRFFVPFSGSVKSLLGRSSVDFIINTAGYSFQQGQAREQRKLAAILTATSTNGTSSPWLARAVFDYTAGCIF
jgi:hypothetical protein